MTARAPVDAWPNNLPLPLTSFIGREAEIAEVRRLVADNRLVTLTGSGGCGKSRLALQAVAEPVEDHPDGAWRVELAPVTDPALVPEAVLAALGLRDAKRPPAEHLTEYLGELRLLLVLDNCEHLLGATAQLVHALLSTCPRLVVLATSREPLGVPGEQTWRVPSLSIPEPGDVTAVEALDGFEATRLFCDRARRIRPNFRLTDDVATNVAVITISGPPTPGPSRPIPTRPSASSRRCRCSGTSGATTGRAASGCGKRSRPPPTLRTTSEAGPCGAWATSPSTEARH